MQRLASVAAAESTVSASLDPYVIIWNSCSPRLIRIYSAFFLVVEIEANATTIALSSSIW